MTDQHVTPQQVIARRRAERQSLLDSARSFAASLDPAVGVRAVVVFGSVARGDFNYWSDVDVLVVADKLPDRPLDRLSTLGDLPARVQPTAWTPTEWRRERDRANPIATEALSDGVWLVGSPAELDAAAPGGERTEGLSQHSGKAHRPAGPSPFG